MPYPIILHHFDESPFSQKNQADLRLQGTFVGVGAHPKDHAQAGLDAADRRLPPHAGDADRADVFCDTQIIIREIERRFPSPTLFPSGKAGVPWALSLWTDRAFFQNAVNLVFGTLGPKVPQEFVEDRSRLRGARFDIEKMRAAIPQMRDQFRAHLGWIESQLSDGRTWLLGDFSLADVSAAMNVWYVRSSLLSTEDQAVAGLDKIFAGLPRLAAWESRTRAIGHGIREEMSAGEALAIAAKASPEAVAKSDPDDPNGRKAGDRVAVVPDDYGKVEVSGEIVSLSAQHIAIRRIDERVGEIVVHFPRAGFLVIPL